MEYDEQDFLEAGDGTRLFYGIRGHGERTLVLNDGIGCDGFAWRYLQPALAAAGHRVVHWHYRGHGRSGPPGDPTRVQVADIVEDLQTLLTALQIERPVLFGHSMGTQISLEHCRHHEVTGLVLMCGSYGRVTHTFHDSDLLNQILPTARQWIDARPVLGRALWGRVPTAVAFQIARLGGEIAQHMRREDFARYWEHVAAMDPEVFLAMLQSAGEHSAQDLLPTLTVPALVVAAGNDTFTPRHLAESMAATLPNSELLMMPDASHALPVEQPEAIMDKLHSFLGNLG